MVSRPQNGNWMLREPRHPVQAARAPPSACYDLHILNPAHQHTNSAAWLTHLLTAYTQAAWPGWLRRREIPEAQGGAGVAERQF